MPNFAALRTTDFPLSANPLRRGGEISTPPSVRGLKQLAKYHCVQSHYAILIRVPKCMTSRSSQNPAGHVSTWSLREGTRTRAGQRSTAPSAVTSYTTWTSCPRSGGHILLETRALPDCTPGHSVRDLHPPNAQSHTPTLCGPETAHGHRTRSHSELCRNIKGRLPLLRL